MNDTLQSSAWLLIAMPLFGGFALMVAGRRSNRWGHWVGVALSWASFVLGAAIFFSLLGLPAHVITQRGVARTFQTLRLFLNMTVKENVMAAAFGRTKAGVVRSILRTPGMRREEREIAALAEEKLAFFGQRLMGYRWDQPAY